jgi:hypothetical protein
MVAFPRHFRLCTCTVALWTLTTLSCGGTATQTNSQPTSPEGGGATTDPIDQVPATCGSIDAAAVARIAPANLERVLRRASRSLDFTDSSLVLPKSTTGHSSSAPWDHKGLDRSIDDLVRSFREDLFVDANLESQAADVVTYRLRPATMCGSSSSIAPLGDAGAPTVPMTKCEKFFTEHELRLEVRRVSCDAGENLRIDLVADPERRKVLAADLMETRLDAAVDVGESIGRLKAYGTFRDSVVFDRAQGRLAFAIDTDAAGAATMRLAVPLAVDIKLHDDSTREGFAVGRADNAFSVNANPTTKKIHAGVALANIDTTMPLKDFVSAFFNRSSTAAGTDVVTLSLPGVQGDFDYDGSADAIAIHSLGLGDSTSRVTHGDATLLAIDVNADTGRHVDVNVSTNPQRELVIDLAPKLRLDLTYSMASVNPLVKNLEAYALDDQVSIQIDGPPGLRLMEAAVGTSTLMRGGTGWLLGMTVGHLALTSRAVPAENVDVAAGKCLFRSTGPFTGQHEILREISSRDCP